MKSRMFIAGALLCASQPALADWVEVGMNSDGSTLYMDLSTARRVGTYIAVWERALEGPKSVKKTQEIKALSLYDCANNRVAVKQSTSYDAAGIAISSRAMKDYELDWREPIPDTWGWDMFYKICPR